MIDSRVDKILNQFLIRRDLPTLFDANRQLPLVPHLKKKKHRRCKNNDSRYSHIHSQKRQRNKKGEAKRSLYNYILLRYNN